MKAFDWAVGNPGSCRWCGIDKQDHCQRWSSELHRLGENGWHGFVYPTQEQIKERMFARRTRRNDVKMQEYTPHPSKNEVNISKSLGLPNAD